MQKSIGAVPGPFDCFLVHRGLRTLAVRMRAHAESARAVSEWLRDADGAYDVRWPGFSGMVSFRHPDAVAIAEATRALHAGRVAGRRRVAHRGAPGDDAPDGRGLRRRRARRPHPPELRDRGARGPRGGPRRAPSRGSPRAPPRCARDRGHRRAHERGRLRARQEDAPAALRAAGLVEALGASDRGDTPRFRWRVDHDEPRAMNAAAVVAGCGAVAAKVAGGAARGRPAARAGRRLHGRRRHRRRRGRRGRRPRLVYLDLHPDLNTPGSVPDGALDWMGVAHMLDVEGADERLAAAGPRRPLLRDDDLVLLGTGPGQCTAAEREAIAARDLRPIGVDDLRADPGGGRARGARAGHGRRPAPSSCTSTSTSSTSPTCRCRRTPAAASAWLRRGAGRARASWLADDALLGLDRDRAQPAPRGAGRRGRRAPGAGAGRRARAR